MCTAGCRGITILFIVLLSESRSFSQPSAAFTATPVWAVHLSLFNSQINPAEILYNGNGILAMESISFLQNPSTTYFNAEHIM
jgi:hypothetical protein